MLKKHIKKSTHHNHNSYTRSIRQEGLEIFHNLSRPCQRLYLDYLFSAWWSMHKPLETMLIDYDFKANGYDKSNYYRTRKKLIDCDLISIIDEKIYINISYADYFTRSARKELYKKNIIPVMFVPPAPNK